MYVHVLYMAVPALVYVPRTSTVPVPVFAVQVTIRTDVPVCIPVYFLYRPVLYLYRLIAMYGMFFGWRP